MGEKFRTASTCTAFDFNPYGVFGRVFLLDLYVASYLAEDYFDQSCRIFDLRVPLVVFRYFGCACRAKPSRNIWFYNSMFCIDLVDFSHWMAHKVINSGDYRNILRLACAAYCSFGPTILDEVV